MIMNSNYVYSTYLLSTLLRLKSGVYDEPISCSLVVIEDYVSASEYIRLPIVGEMLNDITELVCNGKSFLVTKTLYAALHRLSEKAQSQLVWADAICM